MNSEAGATHITVGYVTAPHGLDGSVRVFPTTDFVERLLERDAVQISGPTLARMKIERARAAGNLILMKFAGVDDRNAAEKLRGAELYVLADELPPLPAEEYYWHQLEGLEVREVEHPDQVLGQVTGMVRNGASQDAFEIRLASGGSVLLPARKAWVERVDLDERRLWCHLPPGLLEVRFGQHSP